MKKQKLRIYLRIIKRTILNVLLLFSVILAILFLLSPILLNFTWFYNIVDRFFEPLKTAEYKGAFIGACGGMIGSFLAITGALWVERRLAKDNDQQECEKTALILYYDMKLFYEGATHLATNMDRIINAVDIGSKEESFIICKNQTGIHIHPDWINLVASLTDYLDPYEIKQIHLFFGYVSDMKAILNHSNAEFFNSGLMGRISHILNELGIIGIDKYIPNRNYNLILNKLKVIANYK